MLATAPSLEYEDATNATTHIQSVEPGPGILWVPRLISYTMISTKNSIPLSLGLGLGLDVVKNMKQSTRRS